MESDTLELRRGLGALRRRWRIVVAMVLVCSAAAVGLSLMQNEQYQASATLLLTSDTPTGTDDRDTGMAPEEIATQAEVITSVAVSTRVVDDLALDEEPRTLLDSVTVDEIDENQVVLVTATWTTAEGAAALANAFVAAYLDYRSDQTTEDAVSNRAAYLEQLDTIQERLNEINDEQAQAGNAEQRALTVERQALLVRQATVSAELVTLDGEATAPLAAGQVLSDASAPATPSSPRPVRAGLLGAVVGLLIGSALALWRDHRDDVIRSPGDLEHRDGEPGVTVLGSIPTTSSKDARRVMSLVAPQSPFAEAHRALDTNLRFMTAARRGTAHSLTEPRNGGPAERGQVVLVTSAVAGEGKTSVATNVAVTAARSGQSVVLVDADLRRPQVLDRLGFDDTHGLSDLLIEGQDSLRYLVDVGIPDLGVLSAGRTAPNPGELLASPAMQLVLDELAGKFDLVVVDTAPVVPVADTLQLVPQAQLLLLTVRARVSRLRTTREAVRRIRQVGGEVTGLVVVDVPVKALNLGYGYEGITSGRRRGG